MLGLRWLPKRFETDEPADMTFAVRLRRLRDLGVAVIAGLGMMLISYT